MTTAYRRCNPFAHVFGRLVLWFTGWRVEGRPPQVGKMIIIGAPHTSNWDFVYLLAAAYYFRISIYWLGKDSLFPPVIGSVMRYLGGIAIDRSKRNNVVTSIVEHFDSTQQLVIVIPPAGTRSHTDYWRSGFYQIAKGANIPIVCGFLDYRRKVAGLGPTIIPTGDLTNDMDQIRAFYEPITPRHPESASRIYLKEESGGIPPRN